MDLGADAILAADGLDKLIAAMVNHVAALKDDEARELLHVGTLSDGPLSRQPAEPLASYIARRKRWIARLQSLDASTK
eukprot:727384-Amphidinium_carterae.1